MRARRDGRRSPRKGRSLLDSYRPFARQKQFHDSRAKYRLFGGAAGPGKTKALMKIPLDIVSHKLYYVN